MDNLTHTLTGIALLKAGLERRTPLALPTLLIAANLPDLDALAYLRDPLFALTFRRGWTHGVLAMAVLPLLLAGIMLGWDRMVRLRLRPVASPASPLGLLVVGAIGVLSHPFLDLLNTYGVRLLMPFSERWFYGDTLFIIDPWLWSVLGAGTAISIWKRRRAEKPTSRWRPAQVTLGVVLLYIAGMWMLGRAAWRDTGADIGALGLEPVRVMVSPVPVDPFRRSVLLDLGAGYRWGDFDWGGPAPRLTLESESVAKNEDHPAVAAALQHPDARAFLRWARFPAAAVTPAGIRLYDLRYASASAESWASVLIPAR